MRKLVIAAVRTSDLKTVGSCIEGEFQKLGYCGQVDYADGKFRIVGKKAVSLFVASMRSEIGECRKMFKDAESIAQFEKDEAFLSGLLKIKAT